MEMIDHALAYAEKGFPVFPLHEVDKNGRCSCSEPDQCAEKKLSLIHISEPTRPY